MIIRNNNNFSYSIFFQTIKYHQTATKFILYSPYSTLSNINLIIKIIHDDEYDYNYNYDDHT